LAISNKIELVLAHGYQIEQHDADRLDVRPHTGAAVGVKDDRSPVSLSSQQTRRWSKPD
jgi:hypothetical protein